ncbi:cytochrome c oxidase subunit 7B, mitochondrial [Dipodomys merriami]|uniref:cytochrome c oxidase subunit 7B, mitochondrial n=1 Tax=Dipodomys merriami TaxID=94247 RepID=UPI0038559680
MFSLAKNAISRLQVRSIQQTMARQSHQKRAPDFHDKYGNAILAGGIAFCLATWTYVTRQSFLYYGALKRSYVDPGAKIGGLDVEGDMGYRTATQVGIEWNLSPVGRVTPKEWRDQ